MDEPCFVPFFEKKKKGKKNSDLIQRNFKPCFSVSRLKLIWEVCIVHIGCSNQISCPSMNVIHTCDLGFLSVLGLYQNLCLTVQCFSTLLHVIMSCCVSFHSFHGSIFFYLFFALKVPFLTLAQAFDCAAVRMVRLNSFIFNLGSWWGSHANNLFEIGMCIFPKSAFVDIFSFSLPHLVLLFILVCFVAVW